MFCSNLIPLHHRYPLLCNRFLFMLCRRNFYVLFSFVWFGLIMFNFGSQMRSTLFLKIGNKVQGPRIVDTNPVPHTSINKCTCTLPLFVNRRIFLIRRQNPSKEILSRHDSRMVYFRLSDPLTTMSLNILSSEVQKFTNPNLRTDRKVVRCCVISTN